MQDKEPVVLLRFKDGKTVNETNFADWANQLMSQPGGDGKRTLRFPKLTTSKLRNIYGSITNIYTRINEPADFDDQRSDIQYLKVKMAYETGREEAVKKFLEGTYLMTMLNNIKTYEQFMLYCRYAESLVAYFKFYGGRDN
jgi:CRISPR-associated protein Csm2